MSKQYLILLNLVFLVAFACSDFTEEDLKNDTVVVLGPANGASTETQTLTFWWEAVKGADKYRLQIAEPDFKGIVRLELDTLISTTQFEHTLYPGEFEWRVRAENSAYTTDYFSRLLSILEPVDISKQKVVLVSPGKEAKTNKKQVEFDWNAMSIAQEYQFELHRSDWSGENAIEPKLLTDTQLSLKLEEGKYAWGVLARDKIKKKETPFTYRNLIVDVTAPQKPGLSSPVDKSNVTGLTQTMLWTHNEAQELTGVAFFIQIFSDQKLTTLLEEKKVKLKQEEYTFSATGTYYWRVKAVDEAGNESDYTSAFSFTITNE